MQTLYRISVHSFSNCSKIDPSDSLTFVSKAKTEEGVFRSCKKQLSSFLKPGQLYFFEYFNDEEFLYYGNGFYTGKSFVYFKRSVGSFVEEVQKAFKK